MAVKIKIAFGILLGIFLIVTFQNCGVPLEDMSAGELSESARKAAKYADAPFAFQAEINQITYMSCEKQGNPRGAQRDYDTFFTFKVGSYGSAGVKIRDEFYRYVFDKHKATRITEKNIEQTLVNSKKNKEASLLFSLRHSSSIRDSIFATGANPSLGKDYVNLFPSLTSENIVSNFLSLDQGRRMNYFTGGRGLGNRQLEGKLNFINFDSENCDTGGLRCLLNTKKAYLGLTYSTPVEVSSGGDDFVARSPSHFDGSSSKKAWGKIFQLDFVQAAGNTGSSPSRVLGSVRQFELGNESGPTQSAQANWECPDEYRLKMVSPNDAASECPTTQGDRITNTNRAFYEVIRRHLRVEDWYVNYEKKCVVPKSGDICYDRWREVEYGNCDNTTNKDCAHFVSACVRKDAI